MIWWPVKDAFTESFAPAAMVIVDLRWREVGTIYWGIIGDLLEHLP
jgi:hypothetical protein